MYRKKWSEDTEWKERSKKQYEEWAGDDTKELDLSKFAYKGL